MLCILISGLDTSKNSFSEALLLLQFNFFPDLGIWLHLRYSIIKRSSENESKYFWKSFDKKLKFFIIAIALEMITLNIYKDE